MSTSGTGPGPGSPMSTRGRAAKAAAAPPGASTGNTTALSGEGRPIEAPPTQSGPQSNVREVTVVTVSPPRTQAGPSYSATVAAGAPAVDKAGAPRAAPITGARADQPTGAPTVAVTSVRGAPVDAPRSTAAPEPSGPEGGELKRLESLVLNLVGQVEGLQREVVQRQSGPSGTVTVAPGQPLISQSAPVHRNLGPSLLASSAPTTAAAPAAAAAPLSSPPRPPAPARAAPAPDPIRAAMGLVQEEANRYMVSASSGLPLTGSAGVAPPPLGVAGALGASLGVFGRQMSALGAPPVAAAPYATVTGAGPGALGLPPGTGSGLPYPPPPGLPQYTGTPYGYGVPMGVNYPPYLPPYAYPPPGGYAGYAAMPRPLVPVLHAEYFVGKSLVWALSGVTSAVPGVLGFDPSFATQPQSWDVALAALSSIDVFRKAVWKSGLYLRATGRFREESFGHFASYISALFDLGGLIDRWTEAVPSYNGVEYVMPVGETLTFALQFHRKIMEFVAAGSIAGWPSSLGRRIFDGPAEGPVVEPLVMELLNTYRQQISIHVSNETTRLAPSSGGGPNLGIGGHRQGASSGHPRAAASPSAPSVQPRAAALVDIGPRGSEAFNRNALDVQGKPAPICTSEGTAYCTKFAVGKCTFSACKYAHRCIHCGLGHSLRDCTARDGAGTRVV